MSNAVEARHKIFNGLVWLGFAAGVILATSPVWSRLAFGFDPTLDQLLEIMCVAPR